MTAFIRCILHLEPELLSEDDFYKAWGQVKYYLETIHQVKFS